MINPEFNLSGVYHILQPLPRPSPCLGERQAMAEAGGGRVFGKKAGLRVMTRKPAFFPSFIPLPPPTCLGKKQAQAA